MLTTNNRLQFARGWRVRLNFLLGPRGSRKFIGSRCKFMNHDAAVSNAQEIASRVLAPSAVRNDKEGRFSTEAVESLGESGLLGLMLPADLGGSACGPRTFAAVTATLAETDASVAMVYLMHMVSTATISA